jgi:hypothetical protein
VYVLGGAFEFVGGLIPTDTSPHEQRGFLVYGSAMAAAGLLNIALFALRDRRRRPLGLSPRHGAIVLNVGVCLVGLYRLWQEPQGQAFGVYCVLYAVFAMRAATNTLWWSLHRPCNLPGHCPTCNYDLRGLPAASPCPECGAVAVPHVQAPT